MDGEQTPQMPPPQIGAPRPPGPPGSSLSILPATPADLPQIVGMLRELADYEKLAHAFRATEASLGDLLFGADRVADALMAREGSVAVGLALFYEILSTFQAARGLFLEDLFVRPAYRNRGTGTRLLAAFARVALDRGCGYVEWRTLDWNAPAITLYKARGATALDEWTVYRVDGASLRKLASPDPA